MSKVDLVSDLFPVGTKVLCVENTYRPQINGTTRVITERGKSFARCVMDGKPFSMDLPKRVKDILAVDGTSTTYKLNGRDGIVTLRVIPQ